MLGQRFFGTHRIRNGIRHGGHGRLRGDVDVHFPVVKAKEEPVDLLQRRIQIHTAHQGDASVGGVVVLAMTGDELLIGQIRNELGIAAGYMAIAVVREQQPIHLGLQHRAGIG